MDKDYAIHPAVIISCFLLLGITIGTAAALERFPFSLNLDTTKLELEDLIPGRSDLLQPRINAK